MSTSISSRSHPSLTTSERRAERARSEGSAWRIIHLTLRLTRKSDGKPGTIRYALVETSPEQAPKEVRLRRDGTACRCTCEDWKRRADDAAEAGESLATVEPCKHMIRTDLCRGEDQKPTKVSPAIVEQLETPAPTALTRWAGECLQQQETNHAAFAAEVTPVLEDLARRLGRNPTEQEAREAVERSYGWERRQYAEAMAAKAR